MKKKKWIIAAMVCINVLLLSALMFNFQSSKATAQVVGGGTDYIMMTGQIQANWDAVYIIDLGRRQLCAWRFDKTKKRLLAFRPRDLKRDFQRKAAP